MLLIASIVSYSYLFCYQLFPSLKPQILKVHIFRICLSVQGRATTITNLVNNMIANIISLESIYFKLEQYELHLKSNFADIGALRALHFAYLMINFRIMPGKQHIV